MEELLQRKHQLLAAHTKDFACDWWKIPLKDPFLFPWAVQKKSCENSTVTNAILCSHSVSSNNVQSLSQAYVLVEHVVATSNYFRHRSIFILQLLFCHCWFLDCLFSPDSLCFTGFCSHSFSISSADLYQKKNEAFRCWPVCASCRGRKLLQSPAEEVLMISYLLLHVIRAAWAPSFIMLPTLQTDWAL